jgi:hypothetical protein
MEKINIRKKEEKNSVRTFQMFCDSSDDDVSDE